MSRVLVSLNLPAALKSLRCAKAIKQNKLADDLSVSKSYLSEIEAGKKGVTIELLDKYAEIFGIQVSSIIYLAENYHTGNTRFIHRSSHCLSS